MNVAIIGCNAMGRMHARMAARCGLRIVACGDLREDVARELAAEHGAESSDDCLAVVARPDVDIVAVTTPTPFHTQYIIAAAEAGKHVFCEKPLAPTVADCRAAIAAARKARVKLFVGHVVRYFHEFEALRQQIAAGAIGKPGFAKLYRGGLFPEGLDRWYHDYAKSGGVTLDSMIHDMDWLRYVFGDARRVYCQNLRRTDPEFVDYAMATFRMKNGMIAQVIGTWAQSSGFRVTAEVCGEEGMLDYNSGAVPLTVKERSGPEERPGVAIPASPVSASPYQLEWEDFLAWVREGRTPRVMPDDALQAVRMAQAALKSAETGKPVQL